MAVSANMPVAVSRLITALELILVGVLCFVVVRAVITFVSPESVWENPPITQVRASSGGVASGPVLDTAFNPFDRALAAAVQPVEIGQAAPETTLNLKLFGIRYDVDAADTGSAVLQTSDGAQKNYYVGDEIMSGVSLKSVSKDYVVLSLQGRLERLSTERSAGTTLLTPTVSERSEVVSPNDTPSNKALSSAQIPAGFSIPDFLASHTLTRIAEDGNVRGYQLIQTQPGFDLAALGLQSGDIISKVGNDDLTTGQPQFGRIIADLTGGRVRSATVIRSGKEILVKVNAP